MRQSLSAVGVLALFATLDMSLTGVANADYFPDTPKPDRPGCVVTHCQPIFDGWRHGRRCHWRCPRQAPRRYQAEPPRYAAPPPPRAFCPPDMVYDGGTCRRPDRPRFHEAAGTDNSMVGLALLGLLILAALAWVDARSRRTAWTREADGVDDIMDAAGQMNEAADRADAILRSFRDKRGGG